MAKKSKPKILLTKSSNDSNVVNVVRHDKLPEYQRYFDSSNGVRIFFEPPQNLVESEAKFHKHLKAIVAGRKESFYPEAKELMGDFAKDLVRLFIHYTKNHTGTYSNLSVLNKTLKLFNGFLREKKLNIEDFSDIDQDVYIYFTKYVTSVNASKEHSKALKRVLLAHPNKPCDLKGLKVKQRVKLPSPEEHLDKLLNETYTDKVLIQIMAHVFYELDITIKRIKRFQSIELSDIGYFWLELDDTRKPVDYVKLAELLGMGKKGYQIILDNYFLIVKKTNDVYRWGRISSRLSSASKRLGMEREYQQFFNFVKGDLWEYRKINESKSGSKFAIGLFALDNNFTFLILTYVSLTTGLNLATMNEWKRWVNGKPWYENYDKFFGVDESQPSRDRAIVMVGNKKKTGVSNAKKIPTIIPINSPLFNYLRIYDSVHPCDRENYFGTNLINLSVPNALFCDLSKIKDDNGNVLSTIQFRMFRKVFAGHKLLSLLGNVESPEELVFKLKEALNHESFDTTLFSYIMKSGVGSTIIDSAIVALTSELIEQSINFKGTIKENEARVEENKSVFLCDCTDPSSPTHNLKINRGHCRKYDMCLGCKRSEVYAEHIPYICYRVLQYECFRENNLDTFNALMADKHAVAIDTLERFRVEHSNGEKLLEKGYLIANENFINQTPMLPSILQLASI
ncbi:hypothetical protein AB6D81_02040 [Vibrio splendidus]